MVVVEVQKTEQPLLDRLFEAAFHISSVQLVSLAARQLFNHEIRSFSGMNNYYIF